MPPTLTKDGDLLAVDLSTCRGIEFRDTLDKVRSITGRTYDPENKLWMLPGDDVRIAQEAVFKLQPLMDDKLKEWVRSAGEAAQAELTTTLPDDVDDLQIPWAYGRASWQPESIIVAGEEEPFNGLMKHQRPVVGLAHKQGKLLLCDDMGGGKTGTAISYIEEWKLTHPLPDGTEPKGPKLVICPNSVKGSWENEIELWLGTDEDYVVVDGAPKTRTNKLEAAVEADAWAIVNWEQLRVKQIEQKLKNGGKRKVWVLREPLFEEVTWLSIIADEIHRAKNRKSLQTRGLWRIRADEGVMLGLTGTPLMNEPSELWSLLRWLWPHDYHERGANFSPGARAYWTFFEEYVEYIEGYFGKVITGVKNPDALRYELSGRVVRRTKRQMKLGTKGKRRIPVPVTLNPKQRKLYDEAEQAMWLRVEQEVAEGNEEAKRFAQAAIENPALLYRMSNGASRTVRLRQIIETPATLGGEDDSATLDACVDHILDSRPEQWIVFTEFKPTTECLVERLAKHDIKAAAYHGDVLPEDRRKLGKLFQEGELDVLVGTIKAMGEGITLTAGFNQFWISRDWTPDRNEQGEDRMDRIGQTKQVLVWIAEPKDTVAVSKVAPTNRLKEGIVRTVLPKDVIEEGAPDNEQE